MKKLFFYFSIIALISTISTKGFSQDLNFEFVNNSDYLLYGVHIIPYDDISGDYEGGYEWSDDLLPDVTFSPGVSAPIFIPAGYASDLCTFAVKVTYYAADDVMYEKILCYFDACEYSTLLINSDWSCVYEE